MTDETKPREFWIHGNYAYKSPTYETSTHIHVIEYSAFEKMRAELEESARLHGLGANREHKLLTELEEMRAERDRYLASYLAETSQVAKTVQKNALKVQNVEFRAEVEYLRDFIAEFLRGGSTTSKIVNETTYYEKVNEDGAETPSSHDVARQLLEKVRGK